MPESFLLLTLKQILFRTQLQLPGCRIKLARLACVSHCCLWLPTCIPPPLPCVSWPYFLASARQVSWIRRPSLACPSCALARSFLSFLSLASNQLAKQPASQPTSRLSDRHAKNGLVTSLTTTTTAPAAAARRQRDSTGATKHNGTRKVIIEPGERFFRSFKAFLLGLPALAGSAAEIFRLPGAAAHLAAQGRRQLSAGCLASPRLRSALLALA